MSLLVVPLLGGFFGAAVGGALAGVLMASIQIDQFPDHQTVPARELLKLTRGLRSPWRSRIRAVFSAERRSGS